MTAPERIWATEFTHGDRSWTDNPKIGKYRKEMEYIRADLLDAAEARVRVLEDALASSAASLVAAISLLEQGGKNAAPSNRMFDQMIADYKKSVETARIAELGAALDSHHAEVGSNIWRFWRDESRKHLAKLRVSEASASVVEADAVNMRARVKELEDALTRIADCEEYDDHNGAYVPTEEAFIARAALGEKK